MLKRRDGSTACPGHANATSVTSGGRRCRRTPPRAQSAAAAIQRSALASEGGPALLAPGSSGAARGQCPRRRLCRAHGGLRCSLPSLSSPSSLSLPGARRGCCAPKHATMSVALTMIQTNGSSTQLTRRRIAVRSSLPKTGTPERSRGLRGSHQARSRQAVCEVHRRESAGPHRRTAHAKTRCTHAPTDIRPTQSGTTT